MATAIVEMTSGIGPWLINGSTIASLKATPSNAIDTAIAIKAASQNCTPSQFIATSAKNAGSMTNSPWAKLIVFDACQSSVKPTAVRA